MSGIKVNEQLWAYIFIITAATLWGTLGIYVKELNTVGFSPMQLALVRALGAAVTLALCLSFKDVKLLKIRPRHGLYFVGTGILSFVFFNWCYFIAIDQTSLSVAAVLLYTAPAIVMVLSVILFKEKFTARKIVALVLTFIGCVFVTAFGQSNGQVLTLTGILAGLGAGFGYALYSIFGRYALEKYDPLTVTLYTFVVASLALIPVADVKEVVVLLSYGNALYYAVALCLIGTILPFLFYTKGLAYLDTSKAAIIATLEPIVATIAGILFYSESITSFKLLGIALVVFAVYSVKE